MPDISIRIEHRDGTVDTIEGLASQESRELGGKVDMITANVLRRDVNSITLEENRDWVFLEHGSEDKFGGVLRNISRGGGTVELTAESFERLARDAEPTDGTEEWENAQDSVVIEDAVDQVDDLQRGTIEQVENGLTYIMPHTSPAKKARTVEESTPAYLLYRPDRTVDYIQNPGSDRTTVLSPTNQNIIGDIEPKKNAGDDRITHLRMIGAGEGDAQVESLSIASDWSEGDYESWDTRSNKDITDADTLQKIGDVLIEELNSEYVEVEATIEGVDVTVGDRFPVVHDAEQIDHTLTVVEHDRIIDAEGVRHKVVLSNRIKSRTESRDEEVKDTERYNKAFEGTSVTMNTGGGRQPVNADHNYQFDVYYPDEVIHEHRVKLHVRGRPYRAYSSGAASAGGEHSHIIEFMLDGHQHSVDVTDHIHEVPLDTTSASSMSDSANIDPFGFYASNIAQDGTGSQTFDLPTVTGDGTMAIINVKGTMLAESLNVGQTVATMGVVIESGGETVFRSFNEGDAITAAGRNGVGNTWSVVHTGSNLNGDQLDVTFHWENAVADDAALHWDASAILIGDHNHGVSDALTSEGNGGFAQTTSSGGGYLAEQTTTNEAGVHTHPPEPGIMEVFGGEQHFAEDCQVLVDGTEIGVTFDGGGASFQQDIDLAGELTPGQWNNIEIAASSLGDLQAHLDVDVYRQVRGQG